MAKKKVTKKKPTKRVKQKRIPGTYDEDVAECQDLATELVHARLNRQKAKEKEDQAKLALIEACKSHKIREIRIDGYELVLTEEIAPKIKLKKLVLDAPEGGEEDAS